MKMIQTFMWGTVVERYVQEAMGLILGRVTAWFPYWLSSSKRFVVLLDTPGKDFCGETEL
jgi:hypothetical protein